MTTTAVQSAKVEPNIRADLTLTKDDIINIRISEIEEAALAEIEVKSQENEKLRTRVKELRAKAQAILENYVRTTFGTYGEDLEASLKKYYHRVTRSLSFAPANRHTEDEATDKSRLNISIRFGVYFQNNCGGDDLTLHTEGNTPQDCFDLEAQALALEKDIAANNELIFVEKRKIAQLALTERRARAALSRALLGGDGGKAIMTALNAVSSSTPLLSLK